MIKDTIIFTNPELVPGHSLKEYASYIEDCNFKRASLKFLTNDGSIPACLRLSNETVIWSKSGILMNAVSKNILAIHYQIPSISKSLFFNNGSSIVRLYLPFLDKNNDQYKSLYSSFKTHVLKHLRDKGATFEVVKTQNDMKLGLMAKLNSPSFATLADYKQFSNEYLNEIKNGL